MSVDDAAEHCPDLEPGQARVGAIGEHRGIFQDQVKLSSQTTRDHIACRFQA